MDALARPFLDTQKFPQPADEVRDLMAPTAAKEAVKEWGRRVGPIPARELDELVRTNAARFGVGSPGVDSGDIYPRGATRLVKYAMLVGKENFDKQEGLKGPQLLGLPWDKEKGLGLDCGTSLVRERIRGILVGTIDRVSQSSPTP